MLQRIISKAVAVVLAMSAMTTAALAGPLGSAPLVETRSALTPVAFVYDGQQTLFTNISGFALFLRQDAQGRLFAIDTNNFIWVPVACCAVAQGAGARPLGGLFWQPTGAYGAPLIYDGGYNIAFPWVP